MSNAAKELRDVHHSLLGAAYDRSIFISAASHIENLEAALRAIEATCNKPLSYGRSNLVNKIAEIIARVDNVTE